MTIYVMIIGFYFGTQWQKRNDQKETETAQVRKQVLNSLYGTGLNYTDTDSISENKTRDEIRSTENGEN